MKHDYIKYTRIRQTYSGREQKSTGYILLTGSPYRDDERSSQLRSCLHDDIINTVPRMGGNWKIITV